MTNQIPTTGHITNKEFAEIWYGYLGPDVNISELTVEDMFYHKDWYDLCNLLYHNYSYDDERISDLITKIQPYFEELADIAGEHMDTYHPGLRQQWMGEVLYHLGGDAVKEEADKLKNTQPIDILKQRIKDPFEDEEDNSD